MPVDPNLVPDYYDVIKTPMDLETLERRVLASDHPDFESFRVSFRDNDPWRR